MPKGTPHPPSFYKALDDSFATFTVVCARAAKGDYLGALQQLGASPEGPPAADAVREVLNDTLGAVVKCKHKIGVAGRCGQCGFTAPKVET